MRGCVVTEAAIEERFQLPAHAVPIQRRREDDAIGWQVFLQEKFAEALIARPPLRDPEELSRLRWCSCS